MEPTAGRPTARPGARLSAHTAALEALLAAPTAEAALATLLDTLLHQLGAAAAATGWAAEVQVLRGAALLRGPTGFTSGLSRGAPGPTLRSTSAWGAISTARGGVLLDLSTETLAQPGAAAAPLPAAGATWRRLADRDFTHLIGWPLHAAGGPAGMVVIELRCADAAGLQPWPPFEALAADGAALVALTGRLLHGLPAAPPAAVPGPFPGRSPASDRLLDLLTRFAPARAPLLLRGEVGTGKTRLARWIHAQSGRAGPFVNADVAAIPAEQAAARLFGVARGAFTGAHPQAGVIAAAHQGTLFIDELGRLPLDVQVQLFPLLDEGRYRPVGAVADQQVDLRLLLATNEDLEQAVAEGRFREDLLSRVDALSLTVPPLRDRRPELPAWAAAFAQELGIPGLSDEALAWLDAHPPRHNLRGLRALLQRAALLAPPNRPLQAADLARATPTTAPPPRAGALRTLAAALLDAGQAPLAWAEEQALRGALARAALDRWPHPAEAAAHLGLDPLLRGGNHLPPLRAAVAAHDRLAAALGEPLPPLPALDPARRRP